MVAVGSTAGLSAGSRAGVGKDLQVSWFFLRHHTLRDWGPCYLEPHGLQPISRASTQVTADSSGSGRAAGVQNGVAGGRNNSAFLDSDLLS
jgi:hypothetical protein